MTKLKQYKRINKIGYKDEQGKVIVKPKYSEGPAEWSRFACVSKGGHCGVINEHGEEIIPFIYDDICHLCGNLFAARKNGIDNEWFVSVIDSENNVIIPAIYDEIHCVHENRFVVRQRTKDDWAFGVIDNQNKIIIPFDYKYIDSKSDSFYECYKVARLGFKEYKDKKEVSWYNKDGKKLCECEGKILSPKLLGVYSNGRWGVIDQSNRCIVNPLYDDVACIQDRIIVSKDKYVGILDIDGRIVITPSYLSIECVAFEERNQVNDYYTIYGKYCKEYVFDTFSTDDRISRKQISYIDRLKLSSIRITESEKFNFDCYFILKAQNYSELFSEKVGILANSRYDEIRPLTNDSFAVLNNNKWGVFRTDVSCLTIDCEYDRIVFEGGHVVLLEKGGFWGAKTLVPNTYPNFVSLYDVDIPTKYKEIKILTPSELLFGVKLSSNKSNGEVEEEYTIIDNKDNSFFEDSRDFNNFDKQCEIFNSDYDRILASVNNKWGFVSQHGYITIPFQYDEVLLRDDGFFNVCINGQWGVIDISGKEIVSIKYIEKIPNDFGHALVRNKLTGRYGVLSEDGSELVPSIYEYLMVKDGFIFFTHKKQYYTERSSFFCDNENYALSKWGVIDLNGKVIINPKYVCYKVQDGFLLAGRDGRMIHDYYHMFYHDYTGVFDLYSSTGELIFGGFSEFIYSKSNDIYAFFLGGFWTDHYETIDELGYTEHHISEYKRGNGLWLFLDQNLKSIIRDENGEQVCFNKGTTIAKIEKEYPKEEKKHSWLWSRSIHNREVVDGKITKIEMMRLGDNNNKLYDLPINILANDFRTIEYNKIIISKNFKIAAVDVVTGQQTPSFSDIKFISEKLFFFIEDGKIGLSDYINKIIPAKYFFVTIPINGFFFAAEEIDKQHSRLSLLSLFDKSLNLMAIETVEKKKLINDTIHGRLLISFDDSSRNIEDLIVPELSVFDESFIELVSKEESGYYCKEFEIQYWFSSDYRLEKCESDNYDYGDHYDTDNSFLDAFEGDPDALWNID